MWNKSYFHVAVIVPKTSIDHRLASWLTPVHLQKCWLIKLNYIKDITTLCFYSGGRLQNIFMYCISGKCMRNRPLSLLCTAIKQSVIRGQIHHIGGRDTNLSALIDETAMQTTVLWVSCLAFVVFWTLSEFFHHRKTRLRKKYSLFIAYVKPLALLSCDLAHSSLVSHTISEPTTLL